MVAESTSGSASWTILIFFQEGYCYIPRVYLRSTVDHLGLIVAIVVGLGLVGLEGRCHFAVRCLLPVYPLEDRVLADLIERRAETRVLHKDGLEQTTDQP